MNPIGASLLAEGLALIYSTMTPTNGSTPPAGSISHEELLAKLDAAPKEKLILAVNAIALAKLWDLDESELRNILHSASHEFGDEYVRNALEGGA